MKEIGPIKETALLFYLMPLGALVWALDKCANGGKHIYKTLHAAGTVVSVHIRAVMSDNGL